MKIFTLTPTNEKNATVAESQSARQRAEMANTAVASSVADVEIPTDEEIDAHLARIAKEQRIDATLRSWRNAASSYLSMGDKAAFLSLAELVDGLYESTYGQLD